MNYDQVIQSTRGFLSPLFGYLGLSKKGKMTTNIPIQNFPTGWKKVNAKDLVQKAIECDNHGRLLEAQSNYTEAIQMLLDVSLAETDQDKKNICFERMRQYATRSDQIKTHLLRLAANAKLLEQITIAENTVGRSYSKLFGKYMNHQVREMVVEEIEPYENEQLQNFICFLELAIKNCKNLVFIKLRVPEVKDDPLMWESLLALKRDLEKRNINFHFSCDLDMGENRILLSNGFIIKSSAGLSFYKNYEVFCLGMNDYDYRKCKLNEITIWKIRAIN